MKCESVLKSLMAIVEGKVQAIPSPLKLLDEYMGGGFREGEVTVIAGSEGSGKSHLMVQQVIHCQRMNIPWAYYYLEDTSDDVTKRILAHMVGDRRILSSKPDDVADAMLKITPSIVNEASKMERYIHEHPSVVAGKSIKLTWRDVLQWVAMQANEGTRFMIIDPMTRIRFEEDKRNPFELQADFIDELTIMVKSMAAHIVMICHLGKGEHGSSGNVAGSANITRFAHNVIKLQHHPTTMGLIMDDRGENVQSSWNRTVTIAKARNGIPFTNIAMEAPYTRPGFQEVGLIVPEQQGQKKHGR